MCPRRLLAALMSALLWLATAAHAQDVLPVPPLTARVIDQTGTLTEPQTTALIQKLARFALGGFNQVCSCHSATLTSRMYA